MKRIYLDEDDHRVYLDTYLHEDALLRPCMLVLPGGAYCMVCSDREGDPIARAYFDRGFNAFVLNYRTGAPTDIYPSQLIDASRAVTHIRDNREMYRLLPDSLYAVGFSAGGHLAGSLAILASDPDVLSALQIEKGYNRPDACILCYPVVSAFANPHVASFVNLLGKSYEDMTDSEKGAVSLEYHVDSDSAPLFIWHTAEDETVSPDGSLALAGEYVRKERPVMLHLYPYGTHGVALGNEETECGNPRWLQPIAAGWVDASVEWLDTISGT